MLPELNRAVADAAFEHPSEVQQQCIPNTLLGNDLLCQAKAGMGKTAVFCITVLNRLQKDPESQSALVLCHTRELAHQIKKEFERLGKYRTDVKTEAIYGGVPIEQHKEMLKKNPPHVNILSEFLS